MIVARILEFGLEACQRQGSWPMATAVSTLGETLDPGLDEDDLYTAMDWLLERQERIERGLAKRHLGEGCLVLYDLTSVWMEGRSEFPSRESACCRCISGPTPLVLPCLLLLLSRNALPPIPSSGSTPPSSSSCQGWRGS